MSTLADKIEAAIKKVLDHRLGDGLPNQKLAEIIRYQVAQVYQAEAVMQRYEGYEPITEGYQPGSQIQKGFTPQATTVPPPPAQMVDVLAKATEMAPSGGSSATKPAAATEKRYEGALPIPIPMPVCATPPPAAPGPTVEAQIAVLAHAVERLAYAVAWCGNRNDMYKIIGEVRSVIPKVAE